MSDWAAREQMAKVVAAYGSLLIPFAIGAATLLINWNSQVETAAEACRDRTLKLYDDAQGALQRLQGAGQASPSLRADLTARQSIALDLLTHSCRKGGIAIPQALQEAISRLKAYAPEASTRQSLAASEERAGGTGLTSSSAAVITPAASSSGAIRVYLHISDESQRAAAEALETQLEQQRLGGRPIVVPGVELVAPQPTSSLRCLKVADCRLADALKSLVEQSLPGVRLETFNLSARFENEAGVRPGTYEIWLGRNAAVGSEPAA